MAFGIEICPPIRSAVEAFRVSFQESSGKGGKAVPEMKKPPRAEAAWVCRSISIRSHAKGFRFGCEERHHHDGGDVRHEIVHHCYLAGGGDLINGE
jgi:hypothetical protein